MNVEDTNQNDGKVSCSKCGILKSVDRIIKNRKICKDCCNQKKKEGLKKNIINIDNPLNKINNINGVYFNFTDEANELVPQLGKNKQVGVIAQEIHSIFEEVPDITPISPFDNDGQGNSKSGENYMTVQYDKIIPLLIEGIKELSQKINTLESIISGSK